MPAKAETRATAGTGLEGKVEDTAHKAVEGVQRPMMWTVYYNGRSLFSHLVVDYRLTDRWSRDVYQAESYRIGRYTCQRDISAFRTVEFAQPRRSGQLEN